MQMRYLYATIAAALVLLTAALMVACSTAPVPAGANGSDRPGRSGTSDTRNEPQLVKHPAGEGEEAVVRARVTAAAPQSQPHYALHRKPVAPFLLDSGRERYPAFADNGIQWTAQNPVSTFAVDVDTAAYANMRRQLNAGQLPHPESIRVEELINYFNYQYPASSTRRQPFSVYTEMGPSPWNEDRKLLHVGIRGWSEDAGTLPPANLVFLIDVSGSMQAPNKIDLLKSAMKMMVRQLRPQDRVAIAVYAGAAGEVLEPTAGNRQATIHAAIDNLQAGGSTNGGAGIRLAYNLAKAQFNKGGINRVILATDGDFNVGTTDIDELERLIEGERKSGIALTVLGFGTGNYNDHLMQKIAQIGNGNAAYIDTVNEARKVLVEELGATLNIIARDMKVQIEFNPAVVDTYRLIGYETRHLKREDFNNDRVDAGDVGAGHTVTALYELTLKDDASVADPLRYAQSEDEVATMQDEIGFLKLRYKLPDAETSLLISQVLERGDLGRDLGSMSESFRFAGAVAWLGQLLRHNNQVHNDDMASLIKLARSARGEDEYGYRSEFISLVRTASALSVAVAPDQVPAPREDSEHG